ncbi:MAG: DUF4153 domain-containing protein [Gemmatimonadaceae bacterium]
MSFTSPATAAVAPATEGARPHGQHRTVARRVLLDGLFLGGLADALLHNGLGVGLFIWMIAFASVTVHFARQRYDGLTREQTAWLATALFFAGCFAWRDSGQLLFYDFCAMVGALVFLGATLAPASPMRSVLGQRVRDLGRAFELGIRSITAGSLLAFRESELGSEMSSRRGRATLALRAVVLAAPVILVFGLLLGSADPMFGALVAIPPIDLGNAMSHLMLTAFASWFIAGGLRGAFGEGRRASPSRFGSMFALGTLDVTAILGSIVALFGIFLGVQVGWLFGGERLVRSTTGLSYAEYARHGFFELVWVTLLLLPVLLGTRAFIRDGDEKAVRRHRMLATPLLVLVAGVMASAMGRMALYVHYYGPSVDRLYASVFMLWLALVFAWFGLTILRGRLHDFAAGMAITGFFTLAALNVVDPEALVARASLERATSALQLADSLPATATARATASPIDYGYLTARLDGDAVSEVVRALVTTPVSPMNKPARTAEVRERCDAVRTMLRKWGRYGSENQLDWRRWNVGSWRAQNAVRAHEAALRAVTCVDEAGETPFGMREQRAPVRGEQGYRATGS